MAKNKGKKAAKRQRFFMEFWDGDCNRDVNWEKEFEKDSQAKSSNSAQLSHQKLHRGSAGVFRLKTAIAFNAFEHEIGF